MKYNEETIKALADAFKDGETIDDALIVSSLYFI